MSTDVVSTDIGQAVSTIDVLGTPGGDSVALAEYLQLVARHLDRRGVLTQNVRLFTPTPHRALSASMTLRVISTGHARPAGWHEELGWWISRTAADDGPTHSRPCWLGALVPSAHHAAELLSTWATHDVDEPMPAQPMRYRLSDEPSLLAQLRRALH